ncbi:MAG: hypothetical protein EOO62_08525 [Hymenobacter sp.]|nr:MAG: hypothetical protein EOO62_08525 [Hymenobacter sp.]
MNRFAEGYFLSSLAIWLLASCAGYTALVLYTADVREVAILTASFPSHWPAWGRVPLEFEKLRLVLLGTSIGLGTLGIVLARYRRRHHQAPAASSSWWAKWQQRGRDVMRAWQVLPPQQRRLALVVFGVITVLRFVVGRILIAYDDSTSYKLFVSHSLLTVSTWYPLPNNHIFSNTISWLFYQLYPGFWWSMRVPVLLFSTVGTAMWFLGLLRRSNFRVAALTVTLFSFLETNLFYAAEGRGYAILMILSCLGFFCALRLTKVEAAAHRQTSNWAELVVIGTIGLYTVPTFTYFLATAYGWLGINWLFRGAYARLVSLGLLGCITLAGVAVLYTPLLLISGPASLFQNTYVKSLTAAAFWRALPTYFVDSEGMLMGESAKGVISSFHLGILAAVAVLVGFLLLLRAARQGHLSDRLATIVLSLGVPALWFVTMPYALMLVQHVLTPNRTLAFKTIFMFLLVSLNVDWLLQRAGSQRRWLRTSIVVGTALWGSMQAVQFIHANEHRIHLITNKLPVVKRLLTSSPEPIIE